MASVEENSEQDVVCDLCQTPVSFYCRRCGVNLCDPCIPIHLRVKSKHGHDFVEYISKDDDDTCFCESHPENVCHAYCQTCSVPICIICVSIKHKSHEMSELSDKIEDLLKVIVQENDRLQSFKCELEKILNHTTQILSSLSTIYKQRKDEVTLHGEDLHRHVDITVKTLHEELENTQQKHDILLSKQTKMFEEVIGHINAINRRVTKLQRTRDVREMQTFIPVIEKQKTLCEFSQYSFPAFYERFMKIDFQTPFGYVEKMVENKIAFSENYIKNEFLNRDILETPIVLSVIDTRFPASNDCKHRLNDMTATDDNKVWTGGNSAELNLFDLQGNLQNIVSISCLGEFLCMYNNQVVYSDKPNKVVKIISNAGAAKTMFSTGYWEPRGLTSTASNDLLVCLVREHQSKVVRYSGSGTVLQEIQYDSHCQPLYEEATYITENVNGDIIVTDWKKDSVIAVDRFGILRYTYSGRNSDFRPSSVVNDCYGHIIVTDHNEKRIHTLDRDGLFLRYIIPEGGLEYPHAVCILGNGDMMVGESMSGIAKRFKYLE